MKLQTTFFLSSFFCLAVISVKMSSFGVFNFYRKLTNFDENDGTASRKGKLEIIRSNIGKVANRYFCLEKAQLWAENYRLGSRVTILKEKKVGRKNKKWNIMEERKMCKEYKMNCSFLLMFLSFFLIRNWLWKQPFKKYIVGN